MSYNTIFDKTKSANAFGSLLIPRLIGSGLFTNHLFIYSSFFPYFLFIIIALVTLFYSGFLMSVTAKRASFRFGISSLIFLFWAVYVLGHGILSVLTYRSWYIIACFLAYLALILRVGNLKPVYIFRGIALLVFIEVLFCLLQALGVLSSPDSNFLDTGTWINPNVSAMFLSMCFPALFVLIADAKGIAWKTLGLLIVLTVVSLLLLKCRSAFMGAGIALALHKEALAKYNEAKLFISSPELYKEAAVCWDFSAAEQNLLTALYIDPKTFYTRMALLDLYLQTGNKDAAVLMAHNISSLNPKIPSSKVRRYKAQARSVLKYLNQE